MTGPLAWRGAGAVERGGLENRCARKRTEGSNPSLSAITLSLAPHPATVVAVKP